MAGGDPKLADWLGDYSRYMEEIKRRNFACRIVLDELNRGSAKTGYRETDIDFLYGQIRKILELIMFASVVAHKGTAPGLKREAERSYHAGQLIKWVEAVNPQFFPSPKFDKSIENGKRVEVGDIVQTDADPFLTRAEFDRTYARVCGSFAHASRMYPYGNDDGQTSHVNLCADVLRKILRLLDHHWVSLTEDTSVAVVMQSKEDGKVHVALLKRVATP